MKNVLKIFVLVGILSLGIFTACTDNKDYSGFNNMYRSFGMVEAKDGDIENGFYIRLDNGSWLVLDNDKSVRKVEDQDRILAVYTIIESLEPYEGDKRYRALLLDYAQVFNKEPVWQSFINENPEVREDSIGYDPIRVDEVWSGGKYLNIGFSVARKVNTNTVHFINLVADDVESENGVLNVYLRHNGYDDVPSPGSVNFRYSQAMVSFDMTELLPEGKTSLEIKLHWTQYSSTGWGPTFNAEKKETFLLYGKPEETPSTESLNYDTNNLLK